MNLNEEQINADARRFLLGAMAEDERSAFETAFVADEAVFDHVRAAEDELVEEYVRATLSADVRISLEKNYLASTTNRERVDLTRAMLKSFAGNSFEQVAERASPWTAIVAFFAANRLALGSAFAVLAIVVAGWFFISRNSTPEVARNEHRANEAKMPIGNATETPQLTVGDANEQPGNEANRLISTPVARNDNKPAPEKSAEPRGSTPVLALFAGTVRSGGSMAQLDLPKTANGARLLLNLENDDYQKYSAEVADPDGRVVARSSNIQASGKKVEFFVPAARLANGEYSVRLSGVNKQRASESVADFPFRVVRR